MDWLGDELRRLQQSSVQNSRLAALANSGQNASLQFNITNAAFANAQRTDHHSLQGQPHSWHMQGGAQSSNLAQMTPSSAPLAIHSGVPTSNLLNQSLDQGERHVNQYQGYFQALSQTLPNSLSGFYPMPSNQPTGIYGQQSIQNSIQPGTIAWASNYPPAATYPTNRISSGLGGHWNDPDTRQQLVNTSALPTAITSLARTDDPYLNNSNETTTKFPAVVARPQDSVYLSLHQAFLREQLEFFQANEDDIAIRTRGRTRTIRLGQVGLRCRHCARVSPVQRQKGSVYFPISVCGLYQAGQNLSTAHLQCGVCICMDDSIKTKFADLIPSKKTVSSGGRRYWADCARRMGLVDTEHGIFSKDFIPPGVVVLDNTEVKN